MIQKPARSSDDSLAHSRWRKRWSSSASSTVWCVNYPVCVLASMKQHFDGLIELSVCLWRSALSTRRIGSRAAATACIQLDVWTRCRGRVKFNCFLGFRVFYPVSQPDFGRPRPMEEATTERRSMLQKLPAMRSHH